ncbi:hypothetical protein GCM10007377_05910 [Galliscardovia ingluviei]|uniref:Uncharacterized protein n=1 Tax=Galliscardovia ingluviei TaxID=1769422 RepID=A0A8J3AN86_9BIFI|nr:hypothetical protein GCM10007377_05910 [Galliscardovia ingluviei]
MIPMLVICMLCLDCIIAGLAILANEQIQAGFLNWPELTYLQPFMQSIIGMETVLAMVIMSLLILILNAVITKQDRFSMKKAHLIITIACALSMAGTCVLGITLAIAAQSLHPVLLCSMLVALGCPASLITLLHKWERIQREQ